MKKHIDKLIDTSLRNRHERFKAVEELMNYFSRKKTQKLIKAKQEEISWAINASSSRDKEKEYIIKILTSNEPDGSLLYDWDKRDAAWVESGGYKFSRIGESTRYKSTIRDAERILYKRNAEEISHTLLHERPQRIIDMGGWDGQETIEILSLLQKEAIANITMTTKEISPYLWETYMKNISKWASEKKIPMKASFMYENFFEDRELKSNKDSRVYFFPGGTIGNFEDEMIDQIKYNMTPEGVVWRRPIFMTFFVAPDKKSERYNDDILKLKATYGDPDKNNPYFDQTTHDAIKDWVMSGIYHWLGESVKDKLEFTVTYEDQWEKWGRVLIGARVTAPFTIKVWNESFEKKEGDFVWGIQSRRFALPYFKKLIEKWGYSMKSVDVEQWAALAKIETPYINLENISKEQERTWRNAAKVFGMILLLAAGVYTVDAVKTKKMESDKEKQFFEKIDKDLWTTYGYRWYRESASSIKSAWESVYKWYFTSLYGLEDAEKIKYDFISRYVQERKAWHYYMWQWSYTEPIEVVEEYVAANGMRIQFDKNISLISHPELHDKEEILYNTLSCAKDIIESGWVYEDRGAKWLSATGYYSHAKTYDVYKSRSGMSYDYLIHEEHGKKYVLAREASSNDKWFSIEIGKKLAHDYFTPARTERVSGVLKKILKNTYHQDEYIDMEEKLTKLRIQWYKFDYGVLLKNDEGRNSTYFLHTFFPELHLPKDTTRSFDYNLRSSLDTAMDAIEEITPWFAKDSLRRNEIIGNMFNIMLHETLPWFMTVDHVINRRHMKEWIMENYSDIMWDREAIFPFSYAKNLPDRGARALHERWYSDSSIFEPVSTFDQQRFEVHGTYVTKDGMHLSWGFMGAGQSKTLIASCEDEKIRLQHIESVTKELISSWHFYGWLPNQNTIMNDAHANHFSNYGHIREVREKSLSTIKHTLTFPNTYFAKIMYEDWLNR